MTESFFSAMRLAVMMLMADGQVTAAERNWFRRLKNSFELSRERKQLLQADLREPVSHEKIDAIFFLISNPSDRVRLRSFLGVAMSIDGRVPKPNREFADYVDTLIQNPALEARYFEHEERKLQGALALENEHWAAFERAVNRQRESTRHAGRLGYLSHFFTEAPAPLYEYFPELRPYFILFCIILFIFGAYAQCERRAHGLSELNRTHPQKQDSDFRAASKKSRYDRP